MADAITIYVSLLNEGVGVWRPVHAEPLGDDCYRLVGPVPQGEEWEFLPDSVVRCRPRVLSGDFGMREAQQVAFERINRIVVADSAR